MNLIRFGDCRATMRELIAGGVRVQCCITSPPYFGLRDYGHEGQLGLEKTPAEYVAAMVEVFGLVRELLADDGVLWLNLGDSYVGGGGGLKPKNLIGIPWRVAFALQEAGWYLRQDVIWHKPNPMPESVTDRCTKAHEYMFLLSKSERYFWNAEAMKEPAEWGPPGNKTHRHTTLAEAGDPMFTGKSGLVKYAERQRSKRDSFKREDSKRAEVIFGQTMGTHREDRAESTYDAATRNRRSVWTVATRPYKGAHFATFPAALIEPCVLAGSRPGDIVFDPFMGSGTTAAVAAQHGRQYLGCELNPEYAPLQQERIGRARWSMPGCATTGACTWPSCNCI